MLKKVMLDAGHGGYDSGAVNKQYKEKDFTLRIATLVEKHLKANYDVDVFMTRTLDKEVSLEERVKKANDKKVDFFVSIHINAGGGTGFESYIYNGVVPNSTKQKQEIVHASIMHCLNLYNVRDREMKKADFYVLRKTNMDAILLENLFIDTSKDLELLNKKDFIDTLVVGIAEGIIGAL